MPRLATERPPKEFVAARGFSLPVHRCEALVLGSGAAGLRAAVELKRRGVDVVIATQSAYGGTSACSGSDKQTLHTANGAGRGDDYRAMADALGAGGAMDEDTAYVEAVGSSRALSSLQFMGLPVPQDRLGGVLRYQTDHDEVGRATSCGPRTSRLMVQVLANEAIRLNIPIFNQTTGVRLLVESNARRRCVGALAISPKRRTGDNPLGLIVFLERRASRRHRRTRRALSRQRLSPALFRLARPCAGGRDRCGQPDGKPIWNQHAAGSISLESFRNLRPVHALHLLARLARERAEFPRRLLPDYAASWRRTSSARAISGRSTRPACSTSARAFSTLQSSGKPKRDGRSSWTSIGTR